MTSQKAKTAAFCGVCSALALGLSYLETLLPALPIPGMRLGLSNVVTVFLLYAVGAKYALAVSLVRVVLSAALFGSFSSFLYSAAGAAFSFAAMWLLLRLGRFSLPAVSTAGGMLHNVGQLAVASILFGYPIIATAYLPALLICGALTGIAVGVTAALLCKHLPKRLMKSISDQKNKDF